MEEQNPDVLVKMVAKIGQGYDKLVQLFKLAKTKANFAMPLEILGSIVTSSGQPLVPAYLVQPWTSNNKLKPFHQITSSQHLLDGGPLKYDGNLDWLSKCDHVAQAISALQQIMFSEQFRTDDQKYFSEIHPVLVQGVQAESCLG